jgi:hypothetical protein
VWRLMTMAGATAQPQPLMREQGRCIAPVGGLRRRSGQARGGRPAGSEDHLELMGQDNMASFMSLRGGPWMLPLAFSYLTSGRRPNTRNVLTRTPSRHTPSKLCLYVLPLAIVSYFQSFGHLATKP